MRRRGSRAGAASRRAAARGPVPARERSGAPRRGPPGRPRVARRRGRRRPDQGWARRPPGSRPPGGRGGSQSESTSSAARLLCPSVPRLPSTIYPVRPSRDVLLVLALAALLLTIGLGAVALTDRDEGANAEAAREMLERAVLDHADARRGAALRQARLRLLAHGRRLCRARRRRDGRPAAVRGGGPPAGPACSTPSSAGRSGRRSRGGPRSCCSCRSSTSRSAAWRSPTRPWRSGRRPRRTSSCAGGSGRPPRGAGTRSPGSPPGSRCSRRARSGSSSRSEGSSRIWPSPGACARPGARRGRSAAWRSSSWSPRPGTSRCSGSTGGTTRRGRGARRSAGSSVP